jgi:CBS domain-containing protein
LFTTDVDASLLSALNVITENNLHRLTVVDSEMRVRGVLTNLRLLDVLAGRRGEGIKEREGKTLRLILEEPVHLFVAEYLHKLSQDMPLRGTLSYIMENKVGHILLTDQMARLRGVITDSCILSVLPLKNYGVTIFDLMTQAVHTSTVDHVIRDAVETLSSHKIRRLLICKEHKVVGLMTANEILQKFSPNMFPSGDKFLEKHVNGIMSETLGSLDIKKPKTFKEHEDISVLIKEMRKSKQRGFPVVEDEVLRGIVTPRDVVCKLPRLLGINEFVELIENSQQFNNVRKRK